jgi:RNA polymerase sigma factor (TIGR02999 family)
VGELTTLLHQARGGNAEALAAIFETVYPELRRIAHARLVRDQGGPHLNTTALVHECYLKLAGAERLYAEDRAHFLAYAASAMRSIVVDAARARRTQRRNDGEEPMTLDTAILGSVDSAGGEEEVLHVHEALAELQALDERLSRVVEMRYFGGLSDAEIGLVLDVGERTVRRDWEKARLLLVAALKR